MVSLTIQWTDRNPEVVEFDRASEVTIGRSAACTICIDSDPMVSRMHAVLLIDPPMARIKDLNSTNGLMINDVSFGGGAGDNLVQPRELNDGDEVTIGSTVIKVRLSDESGGSKPTRAVRYEDKGTVISARFADAYAGGNMSIDGGLEKTVSSMPPSMPEVPGYRVKGLIGSGRMGSVYQAVASDTGGIVAVKVINPDVAFSKKMLDDFKHELESARSVRHPNIVRLLNSGALSPQSIYLVLEYVNGEDLASYLKRCPKQRLPLNSAYRLMLQIGSAMCHAHTHGFIHRDLKPESILLYDDDGKVAAKLTDVGLAKCLEDAGITGMGGYSPSSMALSYVAPEQLAELRDTKATADVFALSAIFYQMLTGYPPYDFKNDNHAENLAAVARADIVPIEERLPGLPEPLVVIIDRGLSGEPEERYQNCCDLFEALENVRV